MPRVSNVVTHYPDCFLFVLSLSTKLMQNSLICNQSNLPHQCSKEVNKCIIDKPVPKAGEQSESLWPAEPFPRSNSFFLVSRFHSVDMGARNLPLRVPAPFVVATNPISENSRVLGNLCIEIRAVGRISVMVDNLFTRLQELLQSSFVSLRYPPHRAMEIHTQVVHDTRYGVVVAIVCQPLFPVREQILRMSATLPV